MPGEESDSVSECCFGDYERRINRIHIHLFLNHEKQNSLLQENCFDLPKAIKPRELAQLRALLALAGIR